MLNLLIRDLCGNLIFRSIKQNYYTFGKAIADINKYEKNKQIINLTINQLNNKKTKKADIQTNKHTNTKDRVVFTKLFSYLFCIDFSITSWENYLENITQSKEICSL